MEADLFSSVPDNRDPFTILIPPPNVTGVLHMGHMLNNTIQDVLARRARMQGYNVCWVPGTDHASIATEAKVVAKLKEEGKSKSDVGRKQFIDAAWEWTHKYGGIIIDQLKHLGCSLDWKRERFTMEDSLYQAVIDVFIALHEDGLIYRGNRMINWDPVGKTALSDEEVLHEEAETPLYYVNYPLSSGDGFIRIATTRPETILGDTAVCVHPEDERYKALIGQTCEVPLTGRSVPIIADDYVDPEFGTGALKITPAHDTNDLEIGKRHDLEIIDVLNDDGTLNENGLEFKGQDRFEAREKVAEKLKEDGYLEKIETITNKIGKSERTKAVVEPRMSRQWFVDMKQFMELHPEVLSSVMDGEIAFHPPKFKNVYQHWITNIKDWCISRQLWWGHRIPAWYQRGSDEYVVARTEADALTSAREKWGDHIQQEDLVQDEDVLDTWFSSWIWPISVFDGFDQSDQKELNYYYPTSDLVTGPDIIFFWVARMIMAGYRFKGEKPFNNVYFTGIVRDKQRRKMSKSLGNSPDPIQLMEQFGTDGVRMGLLLSAPAGNDLLFDEALCEQGRNFCNKIWNAYRLIDHWEGAEQDVPEFSDPELAHQWMTGRINETLKEVEKHFEQYRISDAIMALYKLTWNDFCSWYLEWVKPAFGTRLSAETIGEVKSRFDQILRLLHPFMPFITEHLYQQIDNERRFINTREWPQIDESVEAIDLNEVFETISQVRSVRTKNGISPKIPATLFLEGKSEQWAPYRNVFLKLANTTLSAKDEEGLSFISGKVKGSIAFEGVELDNSQDKKKQEAELKRLKGFLVGIEKKLANERFLQNAKPEIVERERQKRADTLEKIRVLEEQAS
jgi:valyl-tRNA synthetase